jgi:hypothetical protein
MFLDSWRRFFVTTKITPSTANLYRFVRVMKGAKEFSGLKLSAVLSGKEIRNNLCRDHAGKFLIQALRFERQLVLVESERV